MKNNSMKKYILEFLAAALLVMAIIGASKYQQKEAIADSSASDGKSAATTESTDSKTALTTSGTEENKNETQSTEPSTEAQGSTPNNTSNASEGTIATQTSNEDSYSQTSALNDTNTGTSSSSSPSSSSTTSSLSNTGTIYKITATCSNGMTLDDLKIYIATNYSVTDEDPKKTIDWSNSYNSLNYKRFETTGEKTISSTSMGTGSKYTTAELTIKFTEASISITSTPSALYVNKDSSSEMSNLRSKLPTEAEVKIDPGKTPNYTVKARSIAWDDTSTITDLGKHTIYGTLSNFDSDMTGFPSSKKASIDIYVKSTKPYLVWDVNVPITNILVDGSDADDIAVTSLTYVIIGPGLQRNVVVNLEEGDYIYANDSIDLSGEITSGISSTASSRYYMQLKSCKVKADDGKNTSTVTLTQKSDEALFDDSANCWEIGSGYEDGIVISLITMPSDYVNTKAVGSFSSNVGLTSSSMDKKKVGEILDYAYLNGSDTLKKGIADIIEDGDDLSVILVATSKSSSDHSNDMKDRARDFGDDSKNAELKKYFDISLYVTKDGTKDEDLKITEVKDEISFEYTIPSDARLTSASSSTTDRYFNVVRYHDGAHSAGISEYKKNETKLTIKTNQFSDFALAYYDKSYGSSSNSRSSSLYGSSSGSFSGSASIADTIDKTNAPKTGDNFNSRKWIYFLVIGIVVALCSFILYQDTREFNEDRKQPKA